MGSAPVWMETYVPGPTISTLLNNMRTFGKVIGVQRKEEKDAAVVVNDSPSCVGRDTVVQMGEIQLLETTIKGDNKREQDLSPPLVSLEPFRSDLMSSRYTEAGLRPPTFPSTPMIPSLETIRTGLLRSNSIDINAEQTSGCEEITPQTTAPVKRTRRSSSRASTIVDDGEPSSTTPSPPVLPNSPLVHPVNASHLAEALALDITDPASAPCE